MLKHIYDYQVSVINKALTLVYIDYYFPKKLYSYLAI